MNRVILFRGKRTGTGKWIFGYLTRDQDGSVTIWPEWKNGSGTGFQVDTETIGQYTGMKDKKGRKIFEGDIVRLCKSDVTTVKWDEKNAAFILFNPNWDMDDMIVLWNCGKREVIGNIHDKLELLKSEECAA